MEVTTPLLTSIKKINTTRKPLVFIGMLVAIKNKMKHFLIILTLIIISKSTCFSQADSSIFYSSLLGWSIIIPEGFTHGSITEAQALEKRAIEAIENSTGIKTENIDEPFLWIRAGQFEALEAKATPFNKEINGSWLETNEGVKLIMSQTFSVQMPASRIDTVSTQEEIDGVMFEKFSFRIEHPNHIIMYGLMYSQLIGPYDVGINIVYVDEANGQRLINALKKSKFDKKSKKSD